MPPTIAPTRSYAQLPQRAVISLSGEDRGSFIQGLISNDVRRTEGQQAIYAALLTPQGKYLHDFFLVAAGNRLLIDCERDRCTDLSRRLGLYKLRSRVSITESTDLAVFAAWGEAAATACGLPDEPGRATLFAGGVALVDPRLADLGVRIIASADDGTAALATDTLATDTLAAAGFAAADACAYDRWRLALGVPDGSRDMLVEKSLPLECGLDDLNGIDWQKGCYMGQELTARMRYRGLVKKRLLPVRVDGPLPPPGTPVLAGGREVGEIRSGSGSNSGFGDDGIALALLRLDALPMDAEDGDAGNGPGGGNPGDGAGAALTADTARLTPSVPPWMKLPSRS